MSFKYKSGKNFGLSLLAALILIFLNATSAQAQKNEFSFLVGYVVTEDGELNLPSIGKISIDDGLTFQIAYGRRFVDAKAVSLHFEVVVAATPGKSIKASNVLLPSSYSSLFITPGVKLKLFPGFFITPFVAVGGGYARLTVSDTLISGQPNSGSRSSNAAVYNYGGGLEVKIFPFVSLRGEVRNFVSGRIDFNLPAFNDRQSNLIPAAGVVIRF